MTRAFDGAPLARPVQNVADVDNKVFPLFESAAQRLIDSMGPSEALCAALALLTGHTKELRSRSMLSNSDDYVTCAFKAPNQIQVRPTHATQPMRRLMWLTR